MAVAHHLAGTRGSQVRVMFLIRTTAVNKRHLDSSQLDLSEKHSTLQATDLPHVWNEPSRGPAGPLFPLFSELLLRKFDCQGEYSSVCSSICTFKKTSSWYDRGMR